MSRNFLGCIENKVFDWKILILDTRSLAKSSMSKTRNAPSLGKGRWHDALCHDGRDVLTLSVTLV
ncbi:hypothetical protein [Flagellimonas algicola]|uniref:Uncharacterized protein n=1 Tax=Flagellimonas algicola TaxID=2583815 RepID=A0ABY2WJ24_9FLAO|nr:hypothetical protein [Allomuricauda algicola]TMU54849.1 hypothetical protein FGG15_11675 [Allomuricauda algicola]